MPKGKNVLAIMLGGKKGPKGSKATESEEPEEEGSDYGDGFKESAQAAMAALQDGDAGKFASSLKDAIITCVEDQERGEY